MKGNSDYFLGGQFPKQVHDYRRSYYPDNLHVTALVDVGFADCFSELSILFKSAGYVFVINGIIDTNQLRIMSGYLDMEWFAYMK